MARHEIGSRLLADTEEMVSIVLLVGRGAEIPSDVRLILEAHYGVIEACDCFEALERSRETSPDLIVASFGAALPDGRTLCSTVRADPSLTFVPVLLLVGSPEARYHALMAGADDCIAAPIEMRELRARIDGLIQLRRRVRDRLRLAVQSPGEFGRSSFFKRVVSTIEEHLAEDEFDVDALARSLAIARAQLYRRLKEVTALSPAKLIISHRLDRAASLLRNRIGTVTEVSYAVGFKSSAHFSRCFRSRFGVAPAEYRKPTGKAASSGG